MVAVRPRVSPPNSSSRYCVRLFYPSIASIVSTVVCHRYASSAEPRNLSLRNLRAIKKEHDDRGRDARLLNSELRRERNESRQKSASGGQSRVAPRASRCDNAVSRITEHHVSVLNRRRLRVRSSLYIYYTYIEKRGIIRLL